MKKKLTFIILLALALVFTACPQTTPASKPSISVFSATPATIDQDAKSSLSWQVSGAETLKLNPGDLDVTGKTTLEITPFATTTYTLTATNNVGNAEAQTTVTVNVPPLEPVVNPEVVPPQPSLPDGEDNPQPVAASRDKNGVQSEFIIGHVLVRPKNDVDLQTFLQRYDGTVISDDSIPEPPANLGITLTPEQRKATEYLVKINLTNVDLAGLKEDAAKVGIGGLLEVSSQEGLLTLAGATDALAEGFSVSPNYLYYSNQTFPTTLLSTEERPINNNDMAPFTDAFTEDLRPGSPKPGYSRFWATGSQSNVTKAWQFVAAYGIQHRAVIAIIDEGFLLDTNGNPLGTDSDFPTIVAQYDFLANDYIADGFGAIGCGRVPNDCVWHGTGAAGVAAGVINNRRGAVGTGGFIADVMLFRRTGTKANHHQAVRTAVLWGADVVSMSYGGPCDEACLGFEYRNVNKTFGVGASTVFVAAAGNTGYDVNLYFDTPCIAEHVICVGALSDEGTTAYNTLPGGWASNVGGSVDIFAPTNIPVMSQPAGTDKNPNGPPTPASLNFGGTSASTPFVAGIAAMMKAVNPTLNSDEVSQILRDTAHEGAPPVTHYIDAYAAVRKAAEDFGGAAIQDRFEPNRLDLPTQLIGAGPWNENDLGLHSNGDLDTFRFSSPQRSSVRIDVTHPETLGTIPWLGLKGEGACGLAVQTGGNALSGGTGYFVSYNIGSGNHVFSLGGGLINAYNLSINLTPQLPLSSDDYETNDSSATAKNLYSTVAGAGGIGLTYKVPKVTIDANLHTSADIDYYLVKGIAGPRGGQTPRLKIYGNESQLTLEVSERATGTTLNGSPKTSQKCDGSELQFDLENGKEYLVKVSGSTGRYTLSNGYFVEVRVPRWVLENHVNYEVELPGVPGPLERSIINPLVYVFPGDRTFSELNVRGAVHLELYDADENLIAEGTTGSQGFDETLSLGNIQTGAVYALQITPKEFSDAGTPLSLSWSEDSPKNISSNLIMNAGAEEGPGSDTGGNVETISSWGVPNAELALPTVIYYNGAQGLPDTTTPGPTERGNRFFAGGPGKAQSGMQQTIQVDGNWTSAIDAGNVKYDFSAFLGGHDTQADSVLLSATFLDANFQALGKSELGPITALDREAKVALLPVAMRDYLPPGTRVIAVALRFTRAEGDYNDGYADNLELTFSEYAP